MRPSTAKAKGRDTENRAVAFLRLWWPTAERRRLNGAKDRGDISGIPGVVVEVKSGADLRISSWLDELDREVENAGADWGILLIRPKGKPDPDDWWVVMRPRQACWLLTIAEQGGDQ